MIRNVHTDKFTPQTTKAQRISALESVLGSSAAKNALKHDGNEAGSFGHRDPKYTRTFATYNKKMGPTITAKRAPHPYKYKND